MCIRMCERFEGGWDGLQISQALPPRNSWGSVGLPKPGIVSCVGPCSQGGPRSARSVPLSTPPSLCFDSLGC